MTLLRASSMGVENDKAEFEKFHSSLKRVPNFSIREWHCPWLDVGKAELPHAVYICVYVIEFYFLITYCGRRY